MSRIGQCLSVQETDVPFTLTALHWTQMDCTALHPSLPCLPIQSFACRPDIAARLCLVGRRGGGGQVVLVVVVVVEGKEEEQEEEKGEGGCFLEGTF